MTSMARTTSPRPLQQTVRRSLAVAALAGLGLLGGCGSGEPIRPLTAEAFVQNRPAQNVGNPIDKPGPLLYNTVHVGLLPPEDHPPESVRAVAPAVQKAVRPASETAGQLDPGTVALTAEPPAVSLPPASQTPQSPQSAAAPAAQATRATTSAPAPRSLGTYLSLGAVLADVNGRPIFTDRVLRDLERPLAAEARKPGKTAEAFREEAERLLLGQIGSYVREEVEFAAAEKALDEQEKTLGRAATMDWRRKEITAAGGSLELARRRWAEQGWDFEERLDYQYRLFLTQIYLTKRIIPLIQVTAQDMRNYYNAHKASDFTITGAAKFRVIRIDPHRYPGLKDEAYVKAQQVRRRAANGEDFATLAQTMNDDKLLASTGGYVVKDGWLGEGAYRSAEVDRAVFKMRPGEVSDIITGEVGDLYIVKLEEIRPGGTMAFTDPKVQDKILLELKAAQLTTLREKQAEQLKKEAIIRENKKSILDALDIIMSLYPQWASAR